MNTWACGALEPDDEKTLRWTVTAVASGPYKVELPGGRRASTARRRRSWREASVPEGSFAGTISDKANHTRIGADGKTVVTD